MVLPPGDEPPSDGREKKEAIDVQLSRALEVIKSWQYFEDLRNLREPETPEVVETEQVASQSVEP